jgi:protein-L-isoaspartate(D-aspartate) O-methyltransferase
MDFEKENEKMVEYLKRIGYLKSKKLEKALLAIPRHEFVPKGLKSLAYKDFPLSIGFNQTISQPSTVVIMTELLDVKKGQRILEIGAGSGWQAAILSYLVGEKGMIYTVEIIKELCLFARKNLEKLGIKNVKIIHADGSQGLKEYAPYDRIIVTAACPKVLKVFVDQLKEGGKLVAPIGSLHLQKMTIVTKIKGEVKKEELPGYFVFVPLRGRHGFK